MNAAFEKAAYRGVTGGFSNTAAPSAAPSLIYQTSALPASSSYNIGSFT